MKNSVERHRLLPDDARGRPRRSRRARRRARPSESTGGVPQRQPRDARGGPVAGVEGERVGVPQPARRAAAEARLVPRRDEGEGRRARAAVEVLVAAADGEVGAAARRGRPAPRPPLCARSQSDERAGRRAPRRRQAGHVVHLARSGSRRGSAGARRRPRRGRRRRSAASGRGGARARRRAGGRAPGRRSRSVGKFRLLGEDRRGGRAGGASAAGEELEEVDRRGVGDRRPRPGRRRRAARSCRHPAREVDPAGVVPAPDEARAPLARTTASRRALARPARQRAERVAVEVDDPLGQEERPRAGGERVDGVEGLGVGARQPGRGHPGDVLRITAVRGGGDGRSTR